MKQKPCNMQHRQDKPKRKIRIMSIVSKHQSGIARSCLKGEDSYRSIIEVQVQAT